MALKIRFSRVGAKNNPLFRIVVAEARSRRDGSPVAVLGRYNPRAQTDKITIDTQKLNYWLSVGARPTEKVAVLLKNYINLNKTS